MNTTDTSEMGYYVIQFFSEAYTLQDETTCNGKIISASELFFKAHDLSCMKENKNWYWEHKRLFQHELFYIDALMLWQ